MQPELIADYQCVVGEGPLWHEAEGRLYWSDIVTGRLFRYDPASGHHEQIFSGEQVGGFTIQEDGSLLLFMERGKIASWRDGALTTLIEEIPAERPTRFNDVIADPRGRVLLRHHVPPLRGRAPAAVTAGSTASKPISPTRSCWRGSASRTAWGSPRTSASSTTPTPQPVTSHSSTTTPRPANISNKRQFVLRARGARPGRPRRHDDGRRGVCLVGAVGRLVPGAVRARR